MLYEFKSKGCIGVPYLSKVLLIDIQEDRVAFIYDGRWYGYYPFSLFKPSFKKQ